ncbi:hypothetical protein BU25DRAFT_409676 [Macroventuria anomochaeta]|uniref:Uncharacterized protein n=1 Tax=Macroventuria anomochaeta TaxID=301207 RepID=A0ACB6S3B5_9PLEO|nr:uncharacterized protein BU25DRAFT_409676 [Macroventuria anomochaeta]KAF2628646.1 hypothetical protein BU25DRAFT_409676 [Macroventuria anomochaeta]
MDSLDFDRLSLDTKYIKFERYFKQLIKLGREVLVRDHSFDTPGVHILNADRYLHLRDKVCDWITHPDNAALFTDRDTYFYLAQMSATMHTVEIALALPHQPINWPGAAPGPDLYWPGIGKRDVYRQFDQLIHDGRDLNTEAMPWNRREDVEMRE